MSHTYGYDALYRLTSASGTYRGADNKSASYTLAMSYDNMHRIKSKSQHITQQGVQFNGTLNAGHDLTYTYQESLGHKFQLSKVEDLNYRTEGTPKEKIDNGHRYLYDANDNLVYINTSRVKKDGKEDEQAVEKKYRWDEENRLLASDENGFVANYWYDADGERTVKSSGEGEQIYVNSEFSGGVTNTAKFSLYVSPYLVASQGGKYTKHIYIGSQRIVSKLGDLASYGADPRRIPYAGTEADGVSVDYVKKYSQQQLAIRENYSTFGVKYNGTDNNDYVSGQGFCCNDDSPEAARAKMLKARAVSNNFHDTEEYERMQFYYHPDHLGSSSYITNLDGEVVQHIEYVPFGEVFIEERNNTWNTPYLFNAKEYDEETGMYYYGARYYEPRISLWMSTDPFEEDDINISSYTYCGNNPIKFTDPDGEIFGLDNAIGALVSGGTEIGIQMVSNALSGEKLTKINWTKVGIATAEGFITSGASTGVRIAATVGSAIAMSAVDNHEKGGMEIAKGALANLAGGAMAKGAGRLANKVGNKTLNRVSNKLIKSKTALTKSVKKNFGVSQKTARKVATNIQSVQKKAAKAVRKSPGKATDIVVSGTTDAIGKQNRKKK